MKRMLLLALALLLVASAPAGPVRRFMHVTIVVMENRNYASIVGSAQAPYFNRVFLPNGMLLRNSHAVDHPSEPNYIALFSGSTHGVSGDPCPVYFSAPNLATELVAGGATFGGYSESMPRDGFEGCYTPNGLYARKHVPWASFRNVMAAQNLVYTALPANPPTVMWITPNMCNDMHDCSTRTGDAWLEKNLPPILAWNDANDGLLIVTWDEADPDNDGTNHIPTVVAGPMVRAGVSDQRVDHYTVLRTIETNFGLACIADECRAGTLAGIWK